VSSIDLEPGQVTAVRTTGIYCRAGCPARPNLGNVGIYPSPVAAEAAGFRPCLRCRSDELPESPISGDAPLVVARALVLIGDGFLDRDDERGLGRQVGVSARQLRRLFATHVGATPSQVARSRRAHFARRLLDDSDLSIGAIAFMSGFGSIRTMNHVMKQTFRFTPRELRARRSSHRYSPVDGGLQLRITAAEPLAFEALMAQLSCQLVPLVEAVDGSVYRRTTTVCGHPGMIEVRSGGERQLHLTAHLPALTGVIDEVARCRRRFGVDRIRSRPGAAAVPPSPGPWDQYEAAICTLVTSMSPRARVATLSLLVTALGEPVPGISDFGLERLFPTPAAVSGADLVGIGLEPRLAHAVAAFTEAYLDGKVTLYEAASQAELCEKLEEVAALPVDTAAALLTAVYH